MKYDFYFQRLEALWQRRKRWIVGAVALVAITGICLNIFGIKQKTPIMVLNANLAAFSNSYSNDPASYEPIETKFLDTVHFKESVEPVISELKEVLSQYRESTIWDSSKIVEYSRDGFLDLVFKVENRLRERQPKARAAEVALERLTGIADSLAKSPNPNPVVYLASHKFRAKNRIGALVQAEYFIEADSALNILAFSDNKTLLKPENLFGKKPIPLPKK